MIYIVYICVPVYIYGFDVFYSSLLEAGHMLGPEQLSQALHKVRCRPVTFQYALYYRNKYREGGDCLDIEDRGWVV